VWRGRTPIDPASGFTALEDTVVQAAFFGDRTLNVSLENLLAAAHAFVGVVRTIQRSSRPNFGGTVQEHHRAEDAAARRQLDNAITSSVNAARHVLSVEGPWAALAPPLRIE